MPKKVAKEQLEKDAYTEILIHLLADVVEIREKIVVNAECRLKLYKEHYRAGILTKSATNLAHYLALRPFDLRHLQTRLSQAGLSSLGRAEASVMSTLDSVIYLLGSINPVRILCPARSIIILHARPVSTSARRILQIIACQITKVIGTIETRCLSSVYRCAW
jgi:hypothetical protein